MKPSILILLAALCASQASARTWHVLNDGFGDAPTVRSLTLVLRDAQQDWGEGEILIQSRLDSAAKVERAAVRQARLETLHLASGGLNWA